MPYRNSSQDYGGRGEGRGTHGNRWSGTGRGGYGSDIERESERSGSSRYGGGYSSDYDREEGYFGGGSRGMQYGQGYSESSRGTGSYNRDYNDDLSSTPYQGARGGYSSGRTRGDYDRERDYGRGTYGGESYYGQGSSQFGSGTAYGSGDRGGYGRRGYPDTAWRGEMEDERGWWDRASDEVSSWFGDEEAERRRQMDARRHGDYRGRGPRSYTRSDDRIKEDINDRLTDDYGLDASDVEVEVNGGEVVLTGTVNSRYAKRYAEDIAEAVSGVKNVENRIRVRQVDYSTYAESGYASGSSTGATGATETMKTDAQSRSKSA